MSAERVTYVDSSAIVKLVVREPESGALRQFLRRRTPLASSALARVEVMRAVGPSGSHAARRADQVLALFDLVRITDRILAAAGLLQPSELRTLDAIHLASAAELGNTLQRVVTYDSRMTDAARALGMSVAAPT